MEAQTVNFELTEEYLGSLYFSPLDIAIIMELNVADFLIEYGYSSYEALQMASEYNSHTDTFKRVQRGRLLGEAQIRHKVFELAKGGSAPSIKQMFEIIDQAKITHQLSK